MCRSFLLPVLLIAATVTTASNGTVPPKTIELAKGFTVAVVCLTLDKPARLVRVMASGFFISEKGDFVTAGHVLDGWRELDASPRGPCFPAIYVPTKGWAAFDELQAEVSWFKFEACWSDEALDIAVCRPGQNPFADTDIKRPLVANLRIESLPDGDAVAFTGFPLNTIRPITSKGFVAAYRGRVDGVPVELVIDKAAWAGASGSPVFDVDGRVVGVLVRAGFDEGSGLAYARPSARIVKILDAALKTLDAKLK